MTSSIPRWALVPLALALVLGLWLAADGRLSGDEPGYLYAAAYQTVPQILAGEVQPSGIPGFTQGRILHVLFLKGVMSLTGAGPQGFRALQVIHLAIVALNVLLIGAIARRLLPQVAETRAAMFLIAMTPIVLYFALKTTADNEALLAALVATWGLLHVASRRGAAGPAAVVVGLVAAALTKNQMIFVPAAFWIAACLMPIDGIDRRRLALQGAAWGAAAGIATIALLEALGIGVTNYLESYASPFANQTPLVAKVMNLGTELGLIWLVLPAALWTHRRRELGFFAIWFLASMAPFLFLSGVEPRHVAVNLAAAGGLAALALEVILRRWQAWHRIGNVGRAALATAGVLILMAMSCRRARDHAAQGGPAGVEHGIVRARRALRRGRLHDHRLERLRGLPGPASPVAGTRRRECGDFGIRDRHRRRVTRRAARVLPRRPPCRGYRVSQANRRSGGFLRFPQDVRRREPRDNALRGVTRARRRRAGQRAPRRAPVRGILGVAVGQPGNQARADPAGRELSGAGNSHSAPRRLKVSRIDASNSASLVRCPTANDLSVGSVVSKSGIVSKNTRPTVSTKLRGSRQMSS